MKKFLVVERSEDRWLGVADAAVRGDLDEMMVCSKLPSSTVSKQVSQVHGAHLLRRTER